jgi:uncharacterized protein (TIGR02145 family)
MKKFYPLFILASLCSTLFFSCKKESSNTTETPKTADPNTFIDKRDGNVYRIVKIGKQIWMAENFRYLPYLTDSITISSKIPTFNVHSYKGTDLMVAKSLSNYKNYAVLYNYAAAKAVCPEGWHLPTAAEWQTLVDSLGGDKVAGAKLKDTTLWLELKGGTTNETGFTARPGGLRLNNGNYPTIGTTGYYWSSTPSIPSNFTMYGMTRLGTYIMSFDMIDSCGLSVRYIKD